MSEPVDLAFPCQLCKARPDGTWRPCAYSRSAFCQIGLELTRGSVSGLFFQQTIVGVDAMFLGSDLNRLGLELSCGRTIHIRDAPAGLVLEVDGTPSGHDQRLVTIAQTLTECMGSGVNAPAILAEAVLRKLEGR